MSLRHDTLTFLSDYGHEDEFVGVVHSVVRAIAPGVTVVDLTHGVDPYDVRGAGLLLARSAQYLCPGVVLAVVDPGVGTDRRCVAVEVGDGVSVLVGPDNGLLAPAVAMCGGATGAVVLDRPDYQFEAPGPTFAGRDILAPAAAHLCAGVPLDEVGTPIDPAGLLPGIMPVSHLEDDTLIAEVLWVDRYGNAQLNVDPDELDAFVGAGEPVGVAVGGEDRVAVRAANYLEVGPGSLGLVVDSYGLVSLVVDRGSAADEAGLSPGTEVRMRALGEGGLPAPEISVALGEPRRRS